jgi:ATP-dependent RNA helicase MSS116
VLLPFERDQLKRIARLGIQPDSEVMDLASKSKLEEVKAQLAPTRLRIRSGHAVLTPTAEAAYTAFLAYYMANSKGLKAREIVKYADDFALSTGLIQAPTIDQKTVSRLGIEGLVEETQ